MRALLATALLLAGPATAWEFTPGTPCLLTHDAGSVQVELTYDPSAPLYTIAITRDVPWQPAPSFEMRFIGPFGLSIGTDRHRLSNEGRTVSVADVGFGNVLNGMQFNTAVTATLGQQSVTLPLNGAEAPVEKFRACDEIPTS